jgi:hypothetical protein
MDKNHPNKIVAKCFKHYIQHYSAPQHVVYKEFTDLTKELREITETDGAIEAMSKLSILRLITMQSSLRFMGHHFFYHQFAAALGAIDKTYTY